jgi:hypothetical protein
LSLTTIKLAALAAVLALPAAASAHSQSSAARGLTGFGATRKAWFAHHVPDPDPRLIRGCCFLPKERDGQDRYYTVKYSHGRVFYYEMHFAPRVSRAAARRRTSREVPPDARLVARVRKATCEQLVYRSAMLKSAHLGSATVGVEFTATDGGGRYRGIVGNVILLLGASTHDVC